MNKLNNHISNDAIFHPQQPNRVANGLINTSKTLSFYFNQNHMVGYEGDTLASALLANDKLFVARSFKYR